MGGSFREREVGRAKTGSQGAGFDVLIFNLDATQLGSLERCLAVATSTNVPNWRSQAI
jgi:hypothetical protein